MSLSSDILALSPLAYYRLGEASGTTMVDSSGNGRDGSYGDVTLGQASLVPSDTSNTSALLSPGGGRAAGVFNSSWMNFGSFSVFARVKMTSLSGNPILISRYSTVSGGALGGWYIGMATSGAGKIAFRMNQSSGGVVTAENPTAFSTGVEYTVTATFNSSTKAMTLYVNGTSVATATATNANYNPSINLNLGDIDNLSSFPFTGYADEIAIFGAELSSAQAAALHTAATSTGAPVSLTGVTADVQIAAPAGTVAAGTAVPVTLTGPTADVQVAAPAGTVTAGTAIPVALTGVTADVQISAPAGTVAAGATGAVALTGVTAGIEVSAPAGTVATSYVEWEQLESYTEAWATIREQLTVAVDPITRRPGYSLKVVDMQGDVLCELTEASIGTSTRTLNGRGGLDFVLPKLSDEVAQVQQFSEVQLWRGGHLVPGGWYVVVDPAIEVDAHVMGFQCSGLSYYFERRLIGGDRPELLLNGGFESGVRYWNFGWSPGGTSGRAPDHLLTRDACEGGKALVVYGDSDNHRQFAWQGFTYTNTHPTEPLWIDVQAQCRIDDFDGPAKDEWMLYADVRPSSGSNTILFADSVRVDETTARDVWTPMSVRVKIAANTTSWVQVRLYPPHGSASFDQVSAKADTALTIRKRDPWQAMEALVEEAQNVDHGKSDLNIYTYGSWSGFKIDRTYQWKDRSRVSEAMDEIVRSRNGPDANMEVGARIRRLTVAPKQGANNGRTLVLAAGDRAGDARIVSYSAGVDGDEVATTAVVQSSWSGGGMSEVVVSSPRTDGLVLEKLYQAEQDTPTSTLLQQGRTAVKYGRADVITKVVMDPDDTTTLMQQLTIGEVVTLDVHDGEVSVRANYRIVQIDLDPNDDQYTYTVVPEV